MAKLTRHDFSGIHDALNKMIIAEVKAELDLLPEKSIEADGIVPLCRIVLSPDCDYEPRDVAAEKVYVNDDGNICIVDRNDDDEWILEEDCDCLDLSDFSYLIDCIAGKADGDGMHNLINASFRHCGYVAEYALKRAIDKCVTV